MVGRCRVASPRDHSEAAQPSIHSVRFTCTFHDTQAVTVASSGRGGWDEGVSTSQR